MSKHCIKIIYQNVSDQRNISNSRIQITNVSKERHTTQRKSTKGFFFLKVL